MSTEPSGGPPDAPRPGGVVDLARYRGRVMTGPAAVPPPGRDEVDGATARAPLAGTIAETAPAPATARTMPGPRPAAAPVAAEGERVIRRVRLGSVARMAFGFSLCGVFVVIGAGVLLWLVLSTLGVVENLESLAEDLGWADVTFDGPGALRPALAIGAIVVVATTVLSVVAAEVFNLLSTMTGGLRAEVGPPPPSRRERRAAKRSAKQVARAERTAAKELARATMDSHA